MREPHEPAAPLANAELAHFILTFIGMAGIIVAAGALMASEGTVGSIVWYGLATFTVTNGASMLIYDSCTMMGSRHLNIIMGMVGIVFGVLFIAVAATA